jgi:3-oxoacyl-[acyl-carrier protein] reductase
MPLKNSVAVLTGAGRSNGVGAATARALAKKGSNILLNCLKSKTQAEEVVEDCKKEGVDARLFVGDLSQARNCQELASIAQSTWGRADIIVNCLGQTKSVPYENLSALTLSDFEEIFATNTFAPFLIAQAFQQLLKQSGNGVIVNVSSAAGITGKGSSIPYAAAKGAENTLTLSLAQALSPEVRVNAVCPSFIDSSWWEESLPRDGEKYRALVQSMQNNNLLRRTLTPHDVAKTIVDIIENPFMTGELIRLDAGAHIGKANYRE